MASYELLSMRYMAIERAKGELNATINTYWNWDDDDQEEEEQKKINKAIKILDDILENL